jgi:hypothetical protein
MENKTSITTLIENIQEAWITRVDTLKYQKRVKAALLVGDTLEQTRKNVLARTEGLRKSSKAMQEMRPLYTQYKINTLLQNKIVTTSKYNNLIKSKMLKISNKLIKDKDIEF